MKPKTLYRGVIFQYQDLSNADWYDADLRVHYEPIIDQHGRKTVEDGNEYGVYMTDTLNVAEFAYGTPRKSGTDLENSPQLVISGEHTHVFAPSIGIVYKINTDGMDIREPFICDQLQGHYNNGIGGTEWIADVIPKENIEVLSVKIGPDLLHEERTIPINGGNLQEQIDAVMSDRISRLQRLSDELEKLPEAKRLRLHQMDMDRYKPIFGENGFAYIDLDNFKIRNAQDVIVYMQATMCQGETIDMKGIADLEKIKVACPTESSPAVLLDVLNEKLESAKIRREQMEREGLLTKGINSTIERLEEWIGVAAELIEAPQRGDIVTTLDELFEQDTTASIEDLFREEACMHGIDELFQDAGSSNAFIAMQVVDNNNRVALVEQEIVDETMEIVR